MGTLSGSGGLGGTLTATHQFGTETFPVVGSCDIKGVPSASVAGTALSVTGPVSTYNINSGNNQPLTAGTPILTGTLIKTRGNGSASIEFGTAPSVVNVGPDTQFTVHSTSQFEAIFNHAKGFLRLLLQRATMRTFSVRTTNAVDGVRGTTLTSSYSQTGITGTTTTAVQTGTVDVTDRNTGITTVVTAGQSATGTGPVPRSALLLPVDTGEFLAGESNTFIWTAYPGASTYLAETTTSAAGFATPNAATPEFSSTALLMPGAFTLADGLIELPVTVPVGALPAGTQVYWRIFPADGAGNILAGTTASDAHVLTIQ